MAIDVDWAGTATNPYRIFIPRADMPIVQASPEIRELDVHLLRLDLRTIEATAPGAPWPETHQHVTETVISGFTYARFVRILPPYVVEFEDGQYAVRAVGANHNILDVKVANQVSLAVQNSAGLIGGSTFTNADRVLLENVEDKVVLTDLRTGRIVKVMENRLEVDFSTQELILYDNDGVTVLQRWALGTADGSPLEYRHGVQTKRGMPQL